MVWTRFMDMHSGGGQKLKWSKILIEATEAEAEIIFQNRFGRNPHRVTCTCCGPDYSLDESKDLEQATAFDRNCAYAYLDIEGNEIPKEEAWIPGKGKADMVAWEGYVERRRTGYGSKLPHIPLDEYLQSNDVLVVYAKDIKPEERHGSLKSEGYVWQE